MTSQAFFQGLCGQTTAAPPSRKPRARQRSVFAHPVEGTISYGVFLEREVTVAFTTPRTSIQSTSGCRGANRTGVPSTRGLCLCACWGGRTLIASFKDSRPTIERPGIAPPFNPSFNPSRTQTLGSSGENRTPISALKGPHPGR